MRLRSIARCAALAAALVIAALAAANAAAFTVTSPAFTDGGMLGTDFAGPGDCGGKNLSPPLSWSNAPSTTQSFAILAADLDGRAAMGVVHWIAYGIAPTVTSIPAGWGSQASAAFVGGPNNRNLPTWLGLCPGVGDPPHHYVFTVYALDLAPTALAPGLNRDAFLAAIAGHAKAGAVIVGRFGR
jgi:Raf kinase inhibitor-like YbhB/YbcL family protein